MMPSIPAMPQNPWSSSSLWWLWSTLFCVSWACLLSWWSCPCWLQGAVWWFSWPHKPCIHSQCCPQQTPYSSMSWLPVVTHASPAPSTSSPPLSTLIDDHRDILVHGLWSCGTDCIFGVHITDMDAKPTNPRTLWRSRPPMRNSRRRNILLHVLLSNATSLLGCEVVTVVCKLAFIYAEKTDKPFSVVCGFMHNWICIAILQTTHCCLWGSHIPSGCMSSPHPQWLDAGAGLSLYHQ